MKYSLYEIVKSITTDTESWGECVDNQLGLISDLFDDLLTSFSEEINDTSTQNKIEELLFNKVLDVISVDELKRYLEYRRKNDI